MNSMTKSACDRFDLAEAKLKSFTRSAVRTKVMLCLMSGEKEVGELEEEIGLRSSTILHSIKEMIEASLIKRTGEGYALTNIGKIQALLLNELVSTIVALDLHQEFWLTHVLSGIPTKLLVKIGKIVTSEILRGSPEAVLRTQEFFISELQRSKEIHGVSPIIIPGYAEAVAVAVENGANVDLVLTEDILNIVLKEYPEVIKGLLAHDNFKLYCLKSRTTPAFTVTDSLFSLGLFRLDGEYDPVQDLNCVGEDAREWGMELFEYYRNMSEQITCV